MSPTPPNDETLALRASPSSRRRSREPRLDNGLPADHHRVVEAALDTLEHLAFAADLEVSRADARRAMELLSATLADEEITELWAHLVAGAAKAVGLGVRAHALSVRDVLGGAARDLPLAALPLGEADLSPVLLMEVASKRCAVKRADRVVWMKADALCALLGAESVDERVTLLVGEARAPMSAWVSPSGAKTPPFRRLVSLLRLERSDVWIGIIYGVGVGVVSLAAPIGVQSLVSTVAFGGLLQPVIVLTALVAIGLVTVAALRAAQTWVVERIQQRVFTRVAVDLAHRLPRVDHVALAGRGNPELVNRFLEVTNLQKGVAMILVDGAGVALATLVGMVLLAFYHPVLLALDVLIAVSLLALLLVPGKAAVASAMKESKEKYAVTAWLEELLRHPVTFKSTSGAELAASRADDLVRAYLDARRKHFKSVFRQVLAALGIQVVASAAVLGVGGWLVIEGKLSLGQLVAAELVVTLVVAGIAKLGKYLETYYDLLAGVDKLGQLVDLPLEAPTGLALPPPSPRAHVSVREVDVEVDSAQVLADVSFTLEAGARAVVRGETGSGKSALIDAIVGLRRPRRGRVEFDGVDARDLQIESLREQVALVRGTEIFAGTVFDNVRAGRSDVGLAEVLSALERVGVRDAVDRLPEGVHSPLSSAGVELSAGQACQLMVARAIASRPRLIVVDGALEALDPRTRGALLDLLFSPTEAWTLLVATNDPSVARRAQQVIQLESGRALELPSRGAKASTDHPLLPEGSQP
ncbi:MAG: ABC transporter ATP-binding protein [Polyangiaceae bacterium]